LVAALIIGTGVGILLDKWLETAPWFLVAFLFLGAIAGYFNVYRLVSGVGLAVGFRKSSNGPPSIKNEDKND
jgi:ATP synthase protein I